MARHTATGVATPLRLGITSDTVTNRLAATLHSFPQHDIIISDGLAADHRTMLDNGLLDLALLPTSAVAGYTYSESLWREGIHLPKPATHPLAADSVIDIRRLPDVSLIIGARNSGWAADQTLASACRTIGTDLGAAMIAHSLEVRLMLVTAGFGFTALPAGCPALTTATDIVGRPFTPSLSLTISATWPKSGLTAAAQRFLEVARSLA